MKISRLYIGDIGIYRNALMENISPKIVVIGGLNRSGKTTLLDILRYMPFGFPRNLRTTNLEYFLECDFENEKKEKISLRLNGLKEPQINYQNVNSSRLDRIYGDIDKFTYSQLYTITLDELKKLNVKNEEEKLQAVLLGAGINDIVQIPKLIDSFRKDKERIGGKNGSPNIKLFKPYYEKLLQGVAERDKALKEIGTFASKEEEIESISKEISFKNSEIDNIKDRILVFEVLENNYDDYKTCNKFRSEIEMLGSQKLDFEFNYLPPMEIVETLYEEYCETYNTINKEINSFNSIIKDDNKVIELQKSEDQIMYYIKNISGLKQKFIELSSLKNDFEVLDEVVLKKMTNISSGSVDTYSEILDIQCDLINEGKLSKLCEDIRYIKEEKKQCIESLEAENLQSEIIKKELKALKNYEISTSNKSYLYTSLIILCVSIFIYFISKIIAAGFFITGITSAILYFFIRQGNLNQINNNTMNLRLQLKSSQNKQEVYTQKLENIDAKESELNKHYKIYKDRLMIDAEISPQDMFQYFKEIKELKYNIINLDSLRDKIEKYSNNLSLELKNIYVLESKFINNSEIKVNNILYYSDELFQMLEIIHKELQNANLKSTAKEKLANAKRKLLEKLKLDEYEIPLEDLIPELLRQYKLFNSIKELQLRLKTLEKSIRESLSSERIQKAFKTIGRAHNIDKVDTIDRFYIMINIYPIKIEIRKEIDISENNLKEAVNQLEALKEKLQIIKLELNNLSTSDKIIKAQRLIDEGRLNLKPLAVKYSVFSAAEYILETVQKDFLDNAKHKILKGAGEIFSKITNGEYKAVLPGDNLLQADYKTVEADGNIEESTSILSRGTAEQLYLSVRLNRIKAINQKLPIIFDDPFVNFDDKHVKNTLKIITDLAEDNQIFIFTCHAEIIKQLNEMREDVQYWELYKGKFNLSNSEELIEHLTKI